MRAYVTGQHYLGADTGSDGIVEELRTLFSRATAGNVPAPDEDYFALGLVSSLMALELVTFVERRFDIASASAARRCARTSPSRVKAARPMPSWKRCWPSTPRPRRRPWSANAPCVAAGYVAEHGLDGFFCLLDIGWGAKSRAICRIAAELNIGQDAVAFDDNDATERAEVAAELPMVRCHSAAQVGELASRRTPAAVRRSAITGLGNHFACHRRYLGRPVSRRVHPVRGQPAARLLHQ